MLREVHPDVSIISLERQNASGNERGGKGTTLTIETARAISAQAPLRPMNGDWRFVIVDDAELLMPDAQKALLKTIEEPPSFMVLLLLTADLEADREQFAVVVSCWSLAQRQFRRSSNFYGSGRSGRACRERVRLFERCARLGNSSQRGSDADRSTRVERRTGGRLDRFDRVRADRHSIRVE